MAIHRPVLSCVHLRSGTVVLETVVVWDDDEDTARIGGVAERGVGDVLVGAAEERAVRAAIREEMGRGGMGWRGLGTLGT